MMRYVCFHGHFYQPPRENPWLEDVELQDSAYPYHDWNERITAECYAPNTASRILDGERRIVDIVNNYSKISFNFGPTLLAWMERHQPEVYQAILDADRLSRERFSGHGSAVAQVYNHMIMPLATLRDKYTHCHWAVRDFQRRFGRDPEGMWLPETAVDKESLEVLADLGISFTILAPHQAGLVRLLGESNWRDVGGGRIDPTMAYLCLLPSGRKIHLFFYDGPIAREVAFGGLLNNGEALADRMLGAFSPERAHPQIVHVATDGETYGHHHRKGDMALAYALYHMEANETVRVTVYGEYLERHPPTQEVEIVENTSWSCIHGVERWRAHCGCSSGSRPPWNQQWRAPLRRAMDQLRDWVTPYFEREASNYLADPWKARNEYIDVVVDRSRESVEAFFRRHAVGEISPEIRTRLLKLLEMQRHTMLMYTSCGWFFDEISGLEATQVIKYAARAIQLARETLGTDFEESFLEILEEAPSNIPELGNGRRVYERYVKPSRIDLPRVAAHYAITSLFEETQESALIDSYRVERTSHESMQAGVLKLEAGRLDIRSEVTREETRLFYAALHLGGHNVTCGVLGAEEENRFHQMSEEFEAPFARADIPELVRLMDRTFQGNLYTLWHLFRDRQQKVLEQVLAPGLEEAEFLFAQMVERNYPLMNFLQELQRPLPRHLEVAAEFLVNTDLRKIFQSKEPDLDLLERRIHEARRWSVHLDSNALGFGVEMKLSRIMAEFAEDPADLERLERIERLFRLLNESGLDLDLWEAQNRYFAVARSAFPEVRGRAGEGDARAAEWTRVFLDLGDHLGVGVP
ncbi:MAG TPA: DUF3536 domain-containing protein [Syntrophobacteraceae bacterium]|nr:DUF3536 domain-containing protein [Syntrophobacteraceae bacterium]